MKLKQNWSRVAVANVYIITVDDAECTHTGGPKIVMAHFFVRLITSSNIDHLSNFFHYQNQEKICNNTITKDPTAPQAYSYTI